MTDSLNIFSEFLFGDTKPLVLGMLSIIIPLLAYFVILAKNPIVSILFLIAVFSNVAIYLFIIGVNFIGLCYILVYVGAVSILFISIVMLINIRNSELKAKTTNNIFIILLTAAGFSDALFYNLPCNITTNFDNFINYKFYNAQNFNVFFCSDTSWDNNIYDISHIGSIGSIMYTSYSILLIIASIILLLAMVGAIIITIKQNKNINQYKNKKKLAQWWSNRFTHGRLCVQITYFLVIVTFINFNFNFNKKIFFSVYSTKFKI